MTDAHTIPVDPSNADAARAWDGEDGAHWVEHADRYDRSLARYDERFMAAARIGAGTRALDVGCGNGQNTRAAARLAVGGEAVGIDLSSALIENARRLAAAEALTNATFVQGDAQIYPFDAASFDVVISRTGAMFFGDPVAAFANLRRALRPGGTLVLLTWQAVARNEWFRTIADAVSDRQPFAAPPPDAPGPFSLSEPARVRQLLGAAGFADVELDDVREPMYFGADADDAYAFICSLGFTKWKLSQLDAAGRARALDTLRQAIAAHDSSDGVLFESAVWITSARNGA